MYRRYLLLLILFSVTFIYQVVAGDEEKTSVVSEEVLRQEMTEHLANRKKILEKAQSFLKQKKKTDFNLEVVDFLGKLEATESASLLASMIDGPPVSTPRWNPMSEEESLKRRVCLPALVRMGSDGATACLEELNSLDYNGVVAGKMALLCIVIVKVEGEVDAKSIFERRKKKAGSKNEQEKWAALIDFIDYAKRLGDSVKN